MTLATQIVTIVSLVFTVTVALVGVIVFLIRKHAEVRRDEWQIRYDIRSMDTNMRPALNMVLGVKSDEPITLLRVLAILQDDETLDLIYREAPGSYRAANEVK